MRKKSAKHLQFCSYLQAVLVIIIIHYTRACVHEYDEGSVTGTLACTSLFLYLPLISTWPPEMAGDNVLN